MYMYPGKYLHAVGSVHPESCDPRNLGMCGRAARGAASDAVAPSRQTTQPPADLQLPQNDLVLDRDEIEMLQAFHRSFNLPGLRFGLVNVVDREDYYPEEDGAAVDPDSAEGMLSQVQADMRALRMQAASLLDGDDEVVEDIGAEATAAPPESARPASRPHSRSVRRPSGRR